MKTIRYTYFYCIYIATCLYVKLFMVIKIGSFYEKDCNMRQKYLFFFINVNTLFLDLTCARSRDSLSCIESCGLGSQSGKCFWRRNSDAVGRMSKDYETCTPNVTTCPDFKCDELERLYPLLCPQDCSGIISAFNVTI